MPAISKTLQNDPRVWHETIGLTLLLALVFLLAWPGMKSPLMLDDLDQLGHVNRFLSWRDCFGQDVYGLFRPVKNLIFYGLTDIPLPQWHAINLAIYLAVIPVVYLFLRRLLESPGWAFAAVALWATCPTQVSTVIWMSCVNITLAVAFTCTCLYFHDLSQTKPGRHAGLAALTGLCLFLAQTSYEIAVIVPALCVLVDALRNRPLFSRASIARYAILAAITLIYLIIRTSIGALYSVHTNSSFVPHSPGWQISVSAPWFLWRHFSMWLMPAGRIEFFGTYIWGVSASPWELTAAWAWLLGIIGLIFYTWRRQPWVTFGLLWFLIASFPSSNFIPIWAGPIADYYLVFPGIGLAIALLGCTKALVDWIIRERTNPQSQRKLIGGSLICFIVLWRVLCIPLFWLQAALWNRPLELYLRSDLTRPAQFHAQTLAARELLLTGHLQEAKELALRSYATAPWHGMSSMVLGRIAFDTADYSEAEKRFGEALVNAPEKSRVHDYSRFHLAKTYLCQESKQHLVKETLLPLLNNPRSESHLPAIYLQINSYLTQNKPSDAHRAATKAVQLHPDDPELTALLNNIEKQFPATTVPPQAPQ
jgi:hypothetical protein